MCCNGARHKTEIGATKRKKVCTVDFCGTLAAILKAAKTEQNKNRFQYSKTFYGKRGYRQQVERQGIFLTNLITEKER